MGTSQAERHVTAEVPGGSPTAVRRDLFLLMGQSNMAGRGVLAVDDRVPAAGIWVLDGQSGLDRDEPLTPMQWRPGAHPLHRNEPHKNQFGLGVDFATTYAAAVPGVEVGLIPCAWGGQPIERLGPGSPLYANTLTRARTAGGHGSLVGVLWHQGESDTGSAQAAAQHATALRHLIDDLRQQLGQPDLAFVIGDLAPSFGLDADPERTRWIATLRAGLKGLAHEDPHCGCASSAGLETAADHSHFTREALREFGRRYAQQMLVLQGAVASSGAAASGPEPRAERR